jgi:hypothetical protein
MHLSPEQQLILLLSRVTPSPDALRDAGVILRSNGCPIDYDVMVKLAAMNGVTPLLYHNLKAFDFVPENVMNRLKNDYLVTVSENVRRAREMVEIITLLTKGGVEAIPLKGPVASDLIFGNPGLYPCRDIDILVKPSDLERTMKALLDEGFRESALDQKDMLQTSYHLLLIKERTVLEVHWTLAFRYFDIPAEFWWEESGDIEYEGVQMPMLSAERYILYTVFRLYSKAFRPLRFLVLTAELINTHRREIDWRKLLAFSQRYRMGRLVLFTLKLLHDLLDAQVPEEIVNRSVHGYDLLKRFVTAGLFSDVRRTHPRMSLFTSLLDTPLDTARVLLRRVFPPASEIRLRYHLPSGSKKVYAYYVLNPLLMIIRKRG